MRTSRALLTAVLTAGLLALPTRTTAASADAVTAEAAETAVTAETAENYVALGDSYASGSGAGDYSDLACTRSENAYPAQWARVNAPASFTFAACGGAVIPDVREDQLSALGESTTLVSISIGGNDSGFASTMISCRLFTTTSCRRALDEAADFVRNELPARLDALYAEIRAAAPHAQVVVMGYPYLYKEGGWCWGGLSATKRSLLNDGSDLLNDTIADRALAAGFTFADGRTAFAGHEICTADPWISDSDIHPTAEGHTYGYLPAFTAAAGQVH
ncbi:SGNH/GDSL hydrolase family protein [Streptomyces aidingensis]|uniref:GDSL-like Lipase/Acylhydrolase family protein n=1 Tax=Streptomyces aidingensis TaxID=910347 RepID=A0A1I1J7I2_9ACTN|nr:SGNH/GDSL hydrolase family protein [Streptomyces aidingensis]SFC43942.1 GDSL-like Lipase/Acylhydrolase family protein [Streptomyces aidingensis]